MTVLGLDIGGANLKASTIDGWSHSLPFPLWKNPAGLERALHQLCDGAPVFDRVAVTMTGELADCFASKAAGVRCITQTALSWANGRDCRFWGVDGQWRTAEQAEREPLLVAAANWHALATAVGQWLTVDRTPGQPHSALLIDIGTTTTDIIPLKDGVPCTQGLTDLTRLLAHELVYTGVQRTPVCAVMPQVQLRQQSIALAAEWFATQRDVYLLLEQCPEAEHDGDTADGRPATRACAAQRLARAVCADASELLPAELMSLAEQLAAAQQRTIVGAVEQVLQRQSAAIDEVVISGQGEFLAQQVLDQIDGLSQVRRRMLSREWSVAQSTAACARAVADLLSRSADTVRA
jgi:(4-(4-[2-(gamma-L-glutamylamino)ethyl]phenoxymethyl)furan-2-yl)methanamine synthase